MQDWDPCCAFDEEHAAGLSLCFESGRSSSSSSSSASSSSSSVSFSSSEDIGSGRCCRYSSQSSADISICISDWRLEASAPCLRRRFRCKTPRPRPPELLSALLAALRRQHQSQLDALRPLLFQEETLGKVTSRHDPLQWSRTGGKTVLWNPSTYPGTQVNSGTMSKRKSHTGLGCSAFGFARSVATLQGWAPSSPWWR
mmetsp:Transcript_75007/g.163762  ORF Transcript_75007/g.163762 Transcript_75007/m.163762 type:complete len:199 (+) Transcript_75007:161-757(+)